MWGWGGGRGMEFNRVMSIQGLYRFLVFLLNREGILKKAFR